MCDNIKIDENSVNLQNFIDSLTDGLYSILYKRISSVVIKDIRILAAFNHFIKHVECSKSFSLAEILRTTENLFLGTRINENAGNKIFMYDSKRVKDKKISEKLMKISISNLFSLFALNNGIIFSANIISEKPENLQLKRFIIATPKKAIKLNKLCEENGIDLTCIGEFSAENQIVFNENEQANVFDKNSLAKDDESNHIELTEAHFNSFMSGYNAVGSLLLLDTISDNNILRLGLDGDLASVFARFLGFYVGVNDFKPQAYRFIYTAEQKFDVSVSKPFVSDGDYLYLLRLHNNQFGMTDKIHLNQLFNYLKEKISVIKYAFPYTNGIESTFDRIAPEGLEYVSLENVENDKFAIVACVGRGESLNGIKIGYYKAIE